MRKITLSRSCGLCVHRSRSMSRFYRWGDGNYPHRFACRPWTPLSRFIRFSRWIFPSRFWDRLNSCPKNGLRCMISKYLFLLFYPMKIILCKRCHFSRYMFLRLRIIPKRNPRCTHPRWVIFMFLSRVWGPIEVRPNSIVHHGWAQRLCLFLIPLRISPNICCFSRRFGSLSRAAFRWAIPRRRPKCPYLLDLRDLLIWWCLCHSLCRFWNFLSNSICRGYTKNRNRPFLPRSVGPCPNLQNKKRLWSTTRCFCLASVDSKSRFWIFLLLRFMCILTKIYWIFCILTLIFSIFTIKSGLV